MWTLELRGGARLVVVAAQWCDAFGVVTRGLAGTGSIASDVKNQGIDARNAALNPIPLT